MTGQCAGDAVAGKSVLEKIQAANGTATANGTPSQPRHFSFFNLTATTTLNQVNRGPNNRDPLTGPVPAIDFSEETAVALDPII